MKKTIALFLALVLLTGLLPQMALPVRAAHYALEGKTISILGDGISTFAGVSDDPACNASIGENAAYYHSGDSGISLDDTWWQQAADALGLELLVNNSASGAYILHPGSGMAGAYAQRCVQLHSAAGEEPDIIAVFLGTNDFIDYPAALGTADIDYAALIRENDDGTVTYAQPATSCEAYAIMLHKMTRRYEHARIYCMTLLPRPAAVGEEAQPTAFNAALAQIAAHFGCTVVDLENCGIDTADFERYMADAWTHPNAEGMDLITQALASSLAGQQIQLQVSGGGSGTVEQIVPMVNDSAVLPDGYIRVEYLDSMDGAYIDTGLAAKSTDKFVLYASALTGTTHSLMGSGSTNTASDRIQAHFVRGSGYTLRFLGAMSSYRNLSASDMVTFTLDLQNGVGYINGQLVLEQSAEVLPTSNTIFLFTKNINGKIDPSYTDDSRIYAYQHYRSGKLMRDMVPCCRVSDGEYGMYDLVGKKFYTNAGEGSFYCDPLGLTGRGAIVMNMDSGEIYYGKNIHWEHPMASITKVMTCVLALENLELDARTPAAISSDLLGGSTMGLVSGESLTVLNALYGLMLPSGNDVAQLLARTVAGDYDSFVKMMNAKAAELGMTNTLFCNASGLADKGLYTTVYDMTKLMRYAMKNETFRTLIATKTYQVKADGKGGKAHSLTNTNQLLGTYDGCIGGKTGTTTASGAHLVAVAERNGVTLVAMILGSDTEHRYSDMIKLLDYGFENVHVHSYTAAVTAPTCTARGFTTHTCACGESYTDTYVNALGHNWGAWYTVEDATCTESGLRQRDCTRCGNVETEEAAAAGHTYESVVTGPTCTEQGFTTFTCTVCSDSYTDNLTDALGHEYVDSVCTRCGDILRIEIAGGSSGDLTWKLTDDGILTFSGSGAMQDYTYKTEMPWYGYFDRITGVVMEEGAESIGDYAFYGMDITSIEIPETVTSIGAYAFKNASALDNVTLPSGLTQLGESAFYACTSLSAIEIPASLWTVRPYTFKNCTALQSVTFHEGNLQKICDGAFYATGLTQVHLPDCLDILDVYVFKNCAALEEITLSSGLTQVREAVLYGTAITQIEIPEGVTEIKPYAFKNCAVLEAVSLPDTLTRVDEAAFYACAKLEALYLPDAVTTIGSYAFRKCTGLTAVRFSEALTGIGESAFYGCTGLTALEIPAKVESIGAYAFKGCTAVATVALPESLTVIGDSAFHTCTGIGTIAVPGNVASIGEYCFSGSLNLHTITFAGDAPAIGTGAFNRVTATASYPGDNATWTAEVMQNYGGTIIWTAA